MSMLDETYLITAKTVFDLANRAREIFESSNMDEKRQLLRFFYSNLRLDNEKAPARDAGAIFFT